MTGVEEILVPLNNVFCIRVIISVLTGAPWLAVGTNLGLSALILKEDVGWRRWTAVLVGGDSGSYRVGAASTQRLIAACHKATA